MKFKYHKDGTLPENDEIFVFGSNMAGRHGAGAARVAYEKFGAQMGIGIGRWDDVQSYAIPTKNFNIETLNLSQIKLAVEMFKRYTYHNQGLNFFITRIGCGLAGYKDSEIAPMFKGCNTNCSFAEEWKEYVEEVD